MFAANIQSRRQRPIRISVHLVRVRFCSPRILQKISIGRGESHLRFTTPGSQGSSTGAPFSGNLPSRSQLMKTIRTLFLLFMVATAFVAPIASAQAPTQPDADKQRADCEELPGVAAKLANVEKTLLDWPNL